MPLDIENVKVKLTALAEERPRLDARIAEVETEWGRVEAEPWTIDAFAEVREYMEAVRNGSRFVKWCEVERAMVRAVVVGRVFGGPQVTFTLFRDRGRAEPNRA